MKAERLGTITIANGQTQGNILSSDMLATARRLVISGPATLAETVTVQAAPEVTTNTADLRTLRYNGAAAVTMTGAGQMVVEWGGGRSVSLVAGGAVAAQRDFTVQVQF
jgi:hypothetical protein